MRTELRHGALAGLAGSTALAVVLLVAGERPLQRAIELETGRGEEVVTRAGQLLGGVAASLLVGVALGLVFAVARRAVRVDDWSAGVRLAIVAFMALHLVPLLKYPPNPPGVGQSETVGRRTALYLVLLAWSVLATWAGWRTRQWLAGRAVPRHLAVPATAVTVIALVGFAFAVLPAGPDPDSVPASVVWSFRLASAAGWATFWLVLGTVHGWLAVRRTATSG